MAVAQRHPDIYPSNHAIQEQEVTVRGPTIKVELNVTVIVDADVSQVTEYMGNSPHPGKDLKKGHFGFAGHNDPVMFRNIAVKVLN